MLEANEGNRSERTGEPPSLCRKRGSLCSDPLWAPESTERALARVPRRPGAAASLLVETVELSPESVEAVARRVAEILDDAHPAAGTRLLTAADVASMLNISRDAVYALADELGAHRVGNGPRARLRFDKARIMEAISCSEGKGSTPARTPAKARNRSKAPRERMGTKPELLPIRGKK